MIETTIAFSIPSLVQQQREFFRTGRTQAIAFRREQLQRLKTAILDRQGAILQAVKTDLGRPAFESSPLKPRLTSFLPRLGYSLSLWVKFLLLALGTTLFS
jgi:acyl-CoA reductase-like NAD-dependent aldehyde dehydrogenase